jgi:hypothetical protein
MTSAHVLGAVALATAYLAFKVAMIVTLGNAIARRHELDRVSSCVSAGLFVTVAQLAVVLLLSSASMLRQSTFIAAALIVAGTALWRIERIEIQGWRGQWPRRDLIALSAVGLVLSVFWARSLFFYDYTWDAQNYGLPRLALWMNYESVLVHMPTTQINLFANEWIGEINALCYGIVAGSYQGFAFGNLEVLLWLAVGAGWVATLLGAPRYWALCLSAVLASSPAILGLASTVKGDLAAVAMLLISLGWLLCLKSGRASGGLASAMLAISLALAVACKITAAFPALAIGAFGVAALGRAGLSDLWRTSVAARLAVAGLLILVTSRYWLNLAHYGDAVKRVHTEEVGFKIEYLVGNVAQAINRLVGVGKGLDDTSRVWALSAGMAGAVWFVLLAALLAARAGRTSQTLALPNAWLFVLATCVLAATFVSMAMLVPYPWTFRYFLPAFTAVLLILCSFHFAAAFDRRFGAWIAIAAWSVVVVDLAVALRPGEILPTNSVKELRRLAMHQDTALERASLVWKHPFLSADVKALRLDDARSLSILAVKELDASLLPFLGSRAQNRIRIVSDEEALVGAAAAHKQDVVVVAAPRAARMKADIREALDRHGYTVLVDNEDFLIALPASRITLTRVELEDLSWTPWNASVGGSLELVNGYPRVESPVPVDTGFVSSGVDANEAMLIYAAFAGAIDGAGAYAAHLSLHAERPLIRLPSGTYLPTRSYRAIVYVPDGTPRRLSFGLGGWGTGKGRIQLAKLEAFRLEVAE